MERAIKLYRRWGNLIFALVALGIILIVLFGGNHVGLANNWDFGRVMGASSLGHVHDDFAFVFIDEYAIRVEEGSLASNVFRILFSTEGIGAYPSIHVLLVRVSVAANLVINRMTHAPLTVYRLGVLGAMTAVLYAMAIFWLFHQIKWKHIWAEIVLKALLLVILCDIGYIAYFNSLYSESLQILAFVMMIAYGIRLLNRRGSLLDFALFTVAAVLFGWSKFVNLPISFLFILAFGAIVLLRKHRERLTVLKVCIVGGGGIAVLLAIFALIPGWMDFDTNFNAVFFGITKDVEEADAVRHLEALGLSGEMVEFASTNAYVRGVQERFHELGFYEEFQENVSKFGLLWFYIRHPGLLMEAIEISLAHSGQIRPWYISNYHREFGRLALSDRFSVWTSTRTALGFDSISGNLAMWIGLIVLFFLAPIHNLTGKKKLWGTLIMLAAILGSGVYGLIIQVIANGEGDLAKHMFVYAQFVDLIIGLLLGALLYGLGRWIALKRFDLMTVIFPAVLTVLMIPLLLSAVRTPRHAVDIAYAQTGNLVEFGSFEGNAMRWLVVEETADTQTLLAMDDIAVLAFDGGNRNDWTYSDIRHWLNTVFLYEILDNDPAILPHERPVFLTAETDDRAEAGDRDLYTFHIPRYAARGMDRAYREYITDRVRLPDTAMMAELLPRHINIGGGFWLETPYFLNGQMMRYVSADGYILMKDAVEFLGVRPVIEIVRP